MKKLLSLLLVLALVFGSTALAITSYATDSTDPIASKTAADWGAWHWSGIEDSSESCDGGNGYKVTTPCYQAVFTTVELDPFTWYDFSFSWKAVAGAEGGYAVPEQLYVYADDAGDVYDLPPKNDGTPEDGTNWHYDNADFTPNSGYNDLESLANFATADAFSWNKVSTGFSTTEGTKYSIIIKFGLSGTYSTDAVNYLSDFTLSSASEAPVSSANNLAANYTAAGGQVTWTEVAGNYSSNNDGNNSLEGGYSWRFGMPNSDFNTNPAFVYIKAAGLKAGTTYDFSYIYQGDYIIDLYSVADANDTIVAFNGDSKDEPLTVGDRAHRISNSFTVPADGDYTITLKMGKEHNNVDCKWDSVYLCDLYLANQNLAANYTAAGGQVTWTEIAGNYSSDNDGNNSLEGGYSWRFGMPESNFATAPAYVYIKAAGLKAGTTYDFSYIYQGDFIIDLYSVADASNVIVPINGDVTDEPLTEGDRAHKITGNFTVPANGDYTITLKMGKEHNNVDCKWDSVYLCDLVLKIGVPLDVQESDNPFDNKKISDWGARRWSTIAVSGESRYGGKGYLVSAAMHQVVFTTFEADPRTTYDLQFSWKAVTNEKGGAYPDDIMIYSAKTGDVMDYSNWNDDPTFSRDTSYPDLEQGGGYSDQATANTFTWQDLKTSFTTTEDEEYILIIKFRTLDNNEQAINLSDFSIIKTEGGPEDEGLPNLAKEYTYSNGNVTWSENAGAYLPNADAFESVNGGHSWKFGMPETDFEKNPAYIYIKSPDMKAGSRYEFSFIYQKDYRIFFDGVDNGAQAGEPVIEELESGDRANKTTVSITATKDGDHTITLKMGKGQNNVNCSWDCVVLCDLVLIDITNLVYGSISCASGGVTNTTGTQRYEKGKEVTFTAAPNSGNTFAGWFDADGNLVSDAAEYTFTVEDDFDLQARFAGTNIPYEDLFVKNGMDGTFEKGTILGWSAYDDYAGDDSSWCSFDRTGYTFHNGRYSLRLRSRYRVTILDLPKLQKDTDYHFSFYITLPDPEEEARVRYMEISASGNTVFKESIASNALKGGSGWHKVDMYFNSGSNTDLQFRLYYTAKTYSDDYYEDQYTYLDDMKLVPYEAVDIADHSFENGAGVWRGEYEIEDGAATAENGCNISATANVKANEAYRLTFKAKGKGVAGASAVTAGAPTFEDWLSSRSVVEIDSDEMKEYTVDFYTGKHLTTELFFNAMGGSITVDDISLKKLDSKVGGILEHVDFESERFALHNTKSPFEIYTATSNDDDKVYSGKKSLRFNSSKAEDGVEYMLDEAFMSATLTNGVTYSLSFYYKAGDGSAIKFMPEYTGGFIKEGDEIHTAEGDGWQKAEILFNNSGFAYIKLVLGNLADATDGDFYVDDIVLKVIAPFVGEITDLNVYCEEPLNVLNNGGFEKPATDKDWKNLPKTAQIISGDAFAGKSFLRVKAGTKYILPVDIEYGASYYFAASVRAGANSKGFIGLSDDAKAENFYNDMYGKVASKIIPTSNKWQRTAFLFGANELGKTYLVISCDSGYIDVDMVQLYKNFYAKEEDPNDHREYIPYDYDNPNPNTVVLNGGGFGIQQTTDELSPQTGETATIPMVLAGMAVTSLLGVLLLRKGQKSKKGGKVQ